MYTENSYKGSSANKNTVFTTFLMDLIVSTD